METIKHPSFGIVSFHRISGRSTLFASPFAHQHCVRLSIARAELSHDLGADHIYGKEKLIDVELSNEQFATLMLSVDSQGAPCTIRHLDHKVVPEFEGISTEADRSHEDLKKSLDGITSRIEVNRKRLAEILAKPSIGKADRVEIGKLLEGAFNQVESAIPFYHKQLQESVIRMVTAAKGEIEECARQNVIRAGKEVLEGQAEQAIKLLDKTGEV